MDLLKEFQNLNNKIDKQNELIVQLIAKEENQKTQELPEIIPLKQACQVLNLTSQSLFLKRKSGEIRAIAKGNRVYIEKAELQRYLSIHAQFNPSKRNKK